MVLASCQDPAGEAARTEAAAGAYPSLHTVPPRPQLSYPVEQRRAIVDGLVADRENARYTSEVIRYRTGLSSIPPPERTTVAAVPLEVEPDPPAAPAAAPSERPVLERTPELLYEDDDLGSFLEDMRDDQIEEAPSGQPEARAAPDPGDAVPPAAAQAGSAAVLEGVGTADGARIIPAIMAAARPEPAGDAGPTTAADEPAPISRPLAPAEPAAIDLAPAAAPQAATAAGGGDDVLLKPSIKPAPGTARIEVANGLVAIEVPPGDEPATALASIAFGPGSAALPPDASARLGRLLGAAHAQGARVKIVGEADAPGLALDRARVVGLALVQGGLPADRLEMTLAPDAAGDRARLFLAAP